MGKGSTYTTRRKVTEHPLGIAIAVLLVGEPRLVGVAEGEVQGLGREVTNDVGSVTTPERQDPVVLSSATEAVNDTVVLAVQTTGTDHLILDGDQQWFPHGTCWKSPTWFWMSSLIRSMGAAAVFETAAETPPTVISVSDLDDPVDQLIG